jgi:hypothetical protein
MTGETGATGSIGEPLDTLQFNTSFTDGMAVGRLQWNTDDGTLEYGLPGGNVNLQIGQEMILLANNASGVTLANGDAVYVSGAQGDRPTVDLADATSFPENVVIGVLTEEIGIAADGYVTTFGLVRGLDTSVIPGTPPVAAGSAIFLDAAVPGGFKTVPPDAPDSAVFIGWVIRLHGSTGIILVHSSVAPMMERLSDVESVAPTVDGQYLAWNLGNLRYELNGDPNLYTPGDGTDWQDTDPTTISEAIDRIAEAVRGGETGPIG